MSVSPSEPPSAAARLASHIQSLETQCTASARVIAALCRKLRAEQIAKAKALRRARDAERKARAARGSAKPTSAPTEREDTMDPALKPLRLRKLEDNWWRACRNGCTYDLYRDTGLSQFRAVIRDRRDCVVAEATFDLARRGAWTRARQFLEAEGAVAGIRRKAVA